MEYTGCVYEAPAASPADVEWRTDAETGQRFPWDLTRDQISGMEFRGERRARPVLAKARDESRSRNSRATSVPVPAPGSRRDRSLSPSLSPR